MSKDLTVAILGATGAVGTRLIQQLADSTIPVGQIKLLASSRSAGETRQFRGQDVVVEEATNDSFDGVDLVLASAGGGVSKKFLPEAVKRGAVCVDNTSAFRMDPEVHLWCRKLTSKRCINTRALLQIPTAQRFRWLWRWNRFEPHTG